MHFTTRAAAARAADDWMAQQLDAGSSSRLLGLARAAASEDARTHALIRATWQTDENAPARATRMFRHHVWRAAGVACRYAHLRLDNIVPARYITPSSSAHRFIVAYSHRRDILPFFLTFAPCKLLSLRRGFVARKDGRTGIPACWWGYRGLISLHSLVYPTLTPRRARAAAPYVVYNALLSCRTPATPLRAA